MTSENPKITRIKIFSKTYKVDWDIVAPISALVSTCVGIFALFVGIVQFNKALDMTDAQINILMDEKFERSHENRPVLRTKDFEVSYKDFEWTYKVSFLNEGKRQADSLQIFTSILAYDGREDLENSYIVPMYHNMLDKSGGLLPQYSTKQEKTLERIDRDVYLVKFQLTYTDQISKTRYPPAVEYYRVDLNAQPAKIRGYFDNHQHRNAEGHEEFHDIFDLYFPSTGH